jgi:hypothetical protein
LQISRGVVCGSADVASADVPTRHGRAGMSVIDEVHTATLAVRLTASDGAEQLQRPGEVGESGRKDGEVGAPPGAGCDRLRREDGQGQPCTRGDELGDERPWPAGAALLAQDPIGDPRQPGGEPSRRQYGHGTEDAHGRQGSVARTTRLRAPRCENALALTTYGPAEPGGRRSEITPSRRRALVRRAVATSGAPLAPALRRSVRARPRRSNR